MKTIRVLAITALVAFATSAAFADALVLAPGQVVLAMKGSKSQPAELCNTNLIVMGGKPDGGYEFSAPNMPRGTKIFQQTGMISAAAGPQQLILPTPGAHLFRVDVSDGSRTVHGQVTLLVAQMGAPGSLGCDTVLQLGSPILPFVFRNAPYGYALRARGPSSTRKSVVAYRWNVNPSDFLPPGLHLNAVTGVLYGNPTEVGEYEFRITVRELFTGQRDTVRYSLVVQ